MAKSKAWCVLVISCFELVLGYSYVDVFPHCVGLCDGGLVNQHNLDLDLNKGTYTNQPFEQFNFGYSAKNIPICSEKQYIKALINKTEKFVKNLRWRTFFFLNPDLENSTKETYGFNSTKSPPFIPELKEFEDGLALLIENMKFRKFDNEFQKLLRKDLNKIKREKKLLIPADKKVIITSSALNSTKA